MLAAASYSERATNRTPGHGCFPYTISLPLFYPLFSLHSITIDDDDRYLAAASCFSSRRRLLLHCFSNCTDDWTRARLAAASFFERTDPSRALIVCRNDALLLLLPHPFPIVVDSYACCCILSRTVDWTQGSTCCCIPFRTGDQSDAGLRLLLHLFST